MGININIVNKHQKDIAIAQSDNETKVALEKIAAEVQKHTNVTNTVEHLGEKIIGAAGDILSQKIK